MHPTSPSARNLPFLSSQITITPSSLITHLHRQAQPDRSGKDDLITLEHFLFSHLLTLRLRLLYPPLSTLYFITVPSQNGDAPEFPTWLRPGQSC